MKHITVEEFQKALHEGNTSPEVDFINVCTPEEYAEHHIAGVRNVPLDALFGHVDELRNKKTIYVHCRSGRRSEKAIETLHALGVNGELINVSGGLIAWQAMQDSLRELSSPNNHYSMALPYVSKKTIAFFLLGIAFIAGLAWFLWLHPSTYIVNESDMLVPADIVSGPAMTSDTLSSEEKADLIFTREEEKLARDVYRALYNQWKLPIFQNISQSETTHMATVGALLEKYGLPDPVATDTPGTFQNQELQALYISLTKQGVLSLEQALLVGATIEDLDIRDINTALGRTQKTDIQNVYENLTRGSRNHLRAFNRQLEQKTGTTYAAQYISAEELTAILNTPQETGNGMGRNHNR